MSKKLTIEFILSKTNNNNPKNIKALNLWGNKFTDISVLSELPSLEIISLVGNQIKDISVFKKLKNIRELYLKDNQISDIAQIDNLKNCKKLEKLVLKDNPICNFMNYTQKILEVLPQLKKLDEVEVKNLKLNKNNNFNSPLVIKDQNQNNSYNIQSPISKNNLSNKSGSESISSDRKGEAKNDSAAPVFPSQILDNLNDNNNYNSNNINNIDNGINIINSYNAFSSKLNNNNINKKDKSDLLNRSFKKKITEGSFRKVVKNKNNLNNKISQEEKNKALLARAINDGKAKNEKLSQTISSGFYQNPFKNKNDPAINEIGGGYKKKIIGNFKQEQEHKENNKNKQNVINTVSNKYQYFDNDKENEEEKKKSSETPKKNIFKKFNKTKPLMKSNKKLEPLGEKIINSKDSFNLNLNNEIKNEINNDNENKIIQNGKEENINKSVVESIKLLMTTLSVDGLKQVQNDIQKLIEAKNKN